jgi:tetratricopeptide (TPR) repeat protein
MLFGLIAIIAILGTGAWFLRQSIKAQNSTDALARGMAAVESGEWNTALRELSLSLTQRQDDFEAVMVFADVRSRVAMPNNGHFAQSLNLYQTAVDLCLSQGLTKEKYIAALSGRAKMEAAISQISRLTDTSLEVLAIDPTNIAALDYLQAIKQSTGDYLPTKLTNLVRGDRTTVQWLEALRADGDSSALRWALEKNVIEPDSLEGLVGLIEALRKGESVERQLLVGVEAERIELVLLALAEETPTLRNAIQIFIAEQSLRDRDVPRARGILDEIDWTTITDARILLFAAKIREVMGTPADLKKAQDLLAAAGQFALQAPDLIVQVAIRYWNSGRSDDASELLERAIEASPGDPEMIVVGALLSTINKSDDADVWARKLDLLAETTNLPTAIREQIEITKMIFEQEVVDQIIRSSSGLNRWRNETLFLCAIGDLASESNRPEIASKAYRLALGSTEPSSNPLNSRLIYSLWSEGKILESFRVANEYAESSQSLRSIVLLCDAWIRLKSLGLNPSDALSGFDRFRSVDELLSFVESRVEENGEKSGFLYPFFVRDAIADGDLERARDLLATYLNSEKNPLKVMALLNIAERSRIGLAPELLAILRRDGAAEGLEDQLVILESMALEMAGDSDASLGELRSHFSGRTDYAARRVLGFELLRQGVRDTQLVLEGFDLIFQDQDDVAPSDLLLILKAVIGVEKPELAQKVVGRIAAVFGKHSVQTALGQGLFSAKFEIDNEVFLRRSIAEIDAVLSQEGSNPELARVLAILHLASANPNPVQAIDVLAESVRRSPESVQNNLFLIDQLQRMGRFQVAEDYLDEMNRRKRGFSQNQRVLLATLFSRQGDLSEMRKSICELAEETGDAADLLACIQLHFNLNEFEEGDMILDKLAARPNRKWNVELMMADREIMRGDPDVGLDLIRNSRSFVDDLDRRIELASRLMQLERWDEVLSELDPSDQDVANSGKAQLLLAMYFLKGNQRDLVTCQTALDRVLDLRPGEASYVSRVVTIAIGEPELRTEAQRYLDKLALVDPERAEIITLRLEFDERLASMASLDGLEERALALLELRPDLYVQWNILFRISSIEYTLARENGDLSEMQRLENLLNSESSRMAQRFRNSSRALGRISQIQLLLNNPSEALLLARDGLQRVVGTPKLGDVLPSASAEFYLQHYGAVLELLAPFVDDISKSPNNRQESWQILFRSLLHVGRVEEAAKIYLAMFASVQIPPNWRPWLLYLQTLDPALAIEGYRIAEPGLSTFDLKLASADAMANVYRKSGDLAVKGEWSRIVAQLSPFDEPNERFQRAVLDAEFAWIDSESEGIEQALRAQGEIPPDFLQKLERVDQLPDSEKRQVNSTFSSLMLFYNNLLARTSEAIRKGIIDPEVESRLIVACRVASDALAEFLPGSPDVLDSRAMFALSLGDMNGAMELSLASLSVAPGSSGFLLTKSRIELAMKKFLQASETAAVARKLERAKQIPDLELIRSADEVIETSKLNGMIEISLKNGVAA